MKKYMILLMSLLLCACTSKPVEPTPTDPSACSFGEKKECGDEQGVAENLIWEKISFEESIKELKGTVVLFYSFNDCPYCKEVKPVLEEASKENENVKTLYVDVQRDERESGKDTYDTLFAIFESALNEEGYDKLYMPYVVFVKDGEIVLTKTSTIDDVEVMDENQREALLGLYKEGYKLIQE